MIAIGALVLQAFVAGIGNAHMLGAPGDAFGIICHGASGPDADSGTAPVGLPDIDKAGQICCLFCTAAALAALKGPSILTPFALRRVAASPALFQADIVIARTIIRAGRSQAPPSRA